MKKVALSLLFLYPLLALQQLLPTQAEATVSGMVLEKGTDSPLPDVTIILNPENVGPLGGILEGPALKSTRTDSEGRFTITGVTPGRYRVTPERDGYVFVMPSHLSAPRDPGVWVQVSPGEAVTDVEIRMQREAIITGRVLDENGRVVPGNQASVALMRYRYDEFGRTLTWVPGIRYPRAAGSFVRMDDQGEYRFYGLPPGDYYLQVSGGFRDGNPPRMPVPVYYPGTIDEAKAEPIHVDAGQEVRLNTLMFQTVPAAKVHLKFTEASGNPPFSRMIQFSNGRFIASGSPQPEITIPTATGQFEVFVSTPASTGRANINLGPEGISQEIVMTRGVHVTMKFRIEDSAGNLSPFTPQFRTFRCALRSQTTPFNPQCVTGRAGTYFGTMGSLMNTEPPTVPPDIYRLEFPLLPTDVYPLAATISGRDILHEPFSIDGETEIELMLSRAAGRTSGAVRDSNGKKVPDAVVALLPEEPLRMYRYLIRSVIADRNGNFEIRGIAPGAYRLYAWPELEGPAYLNSDFMQPFDERGKRIEIEKGMHLSADVTVF